MRVFDVIDKELVPWDGARLAGTALIVATCAGLAVLARHARGPRRWVALVAAAGLAAGWVSLALGDDHVTPDAAPEVRHEAPAYVVGLWIEACAPALGIAVAWLVARRPRR